MLSPVVLIAAACAIHHSTISTARIVTLVWWIQAPCRYVQWPSTCPVFFALTHSRVRPGISSWSFHARAVAAVDALAKVHLTVFSRIGTSTGANRLPVGNLAQPMRPAVNVLTQVQLTVVSTTAIGARALRVLRGIVVAFAALIC